MPSPKDVILGQLQSGQTLIELLTQDLSDPDYFVVPTDGGNHIAWILGHIAWSEDSTVAAITGGSSRIPPSAQEPFKSGSTCVPDASMYPSRKEIDELFRSTRAHGVEAIRVFDESRWDDPSPDDVPRDFFPTIGSLWAGQATHQFWHIGQMTVCRTAMGKKHLFV